MNTFCDACGAKVEWHLTAAGKNIPIDPDPRADGKFYFGAGLKLVFASPGTKPRMFACHCDVCPRKGQGPRRAPEPREDCARWDCDRTDRHPGHCHRCGATDHFAADCEADE